MKTVGAVLLALVLLLAGCSPQDQDQNGLDAQESHQANGPEDSGGADAENDLSTQESHQTGGSEDSGGTGAEGVGETPAPEENGVPAGIVAFLQEDIYQLLCEIQYANNGHHPMQEISDEQKIAFGLVANNAKEEELLSLDPNHVKKDILIPAEAVDRTVNQYFYRGIEEHRSISNYIHAEYEDGVYRVTGAQLIGASTYTLGAITVLPLTAEDFSDWRRPYWADAPENEDSIVCTADLFYHGASHTEIIGKVKISLVQHKDGTYKIDRYRQELLGNAIMTKTTYP